jgi:hypothetical protein
VPDPAAEAAEPDAEGKAGIPSEASDATSWSELDSLLDEMPAEAEALGEDKDWAPVKSAARIAAPKRKQTRRVSDIQRGKDMSVPRSSNLF